MDYQAELTRQLNTLYDLFTQEPTRIQNIKKNATSLLTTIHELKKNIPHDRKNNLLTNLLEKFSREFDLVLEENTYENRRSHLLFELQSLLEHIEPLEISIAKNVEAILTLTSSYLDSSKNLIADHLARIYRLVNESHDQHFIEFQKSAKKLKQAWERFLNQKDGDLNPVTKEVHEFHLLVNRPANQIQTTPSKNWTKSLDEGAA